MINSTQHRGCRIQDPRTRGKHQTKRKFPWCTSTGGCRVQNSGPWDPVVENSRLFVQRGHSARCAPTGGRPASQAHTTTARKQWAVAWGGYTEETERWHDRESR